MAAAAAAQDFGWGTPTFHKMGREKINLIYTFTNMGFDTLISDVDTVWTRNPIPYVEQVCSRPRCGQPAPMGELCSPRLAPWPRPPAQRPRAAPHRSTPARSASAVPQG